MHPSRVPELTVPALVVLTQWQIPPEPCTAAAQVFAVEATETIVGAVEGPSTKV